MLLPWLIEAGDRAHLTDHEAPAGDLEEEDARPRRLGVFEAGVHPLDGLYEMRAELVKGLKRTELGIPGAPMVQESYDPIIRLRTRR